MTNELTVSQWLTALTEGGAGRAKFAEVYGGDGSVLTQRVALLRRVLERFRERFGDLPVRIFRAPSRINFRGMHVDTHGGCLNLMTHQREVVVAACLSDDEAFHFTNTDAQFEDISFSIGEEAASPSFRGKWLAFISDAGVRGQVNASQGHWSHYLRGSALRVQHAFSGRPLAGLKAAVGGDAPHGAGLSSSAALCVALVDAVSALNDRNLDRDERILAAVDAEWFTGSRCGTSDPAASVLGRRGHIVNVSLLASDFSTGGARYVAFPEELSALVVNSYTVRNISGAELVNFTRNRFAYSMAMEVLRQELARLGWEAAFVQGIDRLTAIKPDLLGGARRFYELLLRVPGEIPLDELRNRYDLTDLDKQYALYFDNVPEKQRPRQIGLRGPLLYGLAETERARCFAGALGEGDFERAGRLMTTGHNGDRVMNLDGAPFGRMSDDATLQAMSDADMPVEACPGDYGASSPALDALVDTALAAGALGACLTGAGIAGSVLALCRRADAYAVSAELRAMLSSPFYASRAGRVEPLSADDLDNAVLANDAPPGAGELEL